MKKALLTFCALGLSTILAEQPKSVDPNAIVHIRSNMQQTNFQQPYAPEPASLALGSGFFIDDQGHFLTNFHVIQESIQVCIQLESLGQERFECEVIGTAPDHDISLVKLKSSELQRFKSVVGAVPYLELGDSNTLTQDTEVYTLGYPLGRETMKKAKGTVSGWEDIIIAEQSCALPCIETTAAFNSGSSGGPLLNADNKVIGITHAGARRSDGSYVDNRGYALPINTLKPIIKRLFTEPMIKHNWIGMELQHSSPTLLESVKCSEQGCLVIDVVKESLADSLEIHAGDILTSINGYSVDNHGLIQQAAQTSKTSVYAFLHSLPEGSSLDVRVYREGEPYNLHGNLERKAQPAILLSRPPYEKVDYEVLGGMVIMNLADEHVDGYKRANPEVLKYKRLQDKFKNALIMSYVQPSSEAEKSRELFDGALIKKINGQKVSTLQELREIAMQILQNPNPAQENLEIELTNNHKAVLNIGTIAKDEYRLAQIFRYPPEHSIMLTQVLRAMNQQPPA